MPRLDEAPSPARPRRPAEREQEVTSAGACPPAPRPRPEEERHAAAACLGQSSRLPLAAGRPQGGRAAALRPGGAARSCRVDSAGSWPGGEAGWRRRRRRRVPAALRGMAFMEKPPAGKVLLDDTVPLTAQIEASQSLHSHTVSGGGGQGRGGGGREPGRRGGTPRGAGVTGGGRREGAGGERGRAGRLPGSRPGGVGDRPRSLRGGQGASPGRRGEMGAAGQGVPGGLGSCGGAERGPWDRRGVRGQPPGEPLRWGCGVGGLLVLLLLPPPVLSVKWVLCLSSSVAAWGGRWASCYLGLASALREASRRRTQEISVRNFCLSWDPSPRLEQRWVLAGPSQQPR